MSSTYDLYFDPESSDPWTIATSGAREYGWPIVRHVLDNGYELSGTETDDELRDWAADLVRGGLSPQLPDDLMYEGIELTTEQEIAAQYTILLFCRDNTRQDERE